MAKYRRGVDRFLSRETSTDLEMMGGREVGRREDYVGWPSGQVEYRLSKLTRP